MHNKWPRCFFCPPECDDCLWGFDNAMSVSAPSSVINIYRCFNNFVFCEAGGARAIMYSENISKHRHECHQGKQTAPSKVIFLVTSVISKWRKWDWEIMKMVRSDRNGVFVRNTFFYITIEHLDIVQMSPFQITLEGCQMKMFRPSWWLEISSLKDILRYILLFECSGLNYDHFRKRK